LKDQKAKELEKKVYTYDATKEEPLVFIQTLKPEKFSKDCQYETRVNYRKPVL
jgi:hypothetical protein